MKLHAIMATAGIVALLAGCAQQEEHAMVAPEPTFDKYGNGSCDEGWIYVPGAAPENPCIPEDECDPVYDSAGNIIDCPPPRTPIPDDGDPISRGSATAGTPGGARP